jgi:hypothetical protein
VATRTRKAKPLGERERSRRARQAAASKAPPADAGAAAAGDPQLIAAAAAALNPEAAAAAAMAAGGEGEPPPPPLTMDQIPPDAARALGPLLERAKAGAGGGALPEDDKKRAKKFTILELELAELLTFPAGPALMAGDEFCGQHFAVQGPLLARQLTVYAESHPGTYNTLSWLARQGSLLVIATAIVGYIVPPAIHHGLPAPGAMRQHYGMGAPGHAANAQAAEDWQAGLRATA